MAEIDLKSLPLHELLSAPLTAAIEAQQQASIGLLSFIRDIGFTDDDDQSDKSADGRDDSGKGGRADGDDRSGKDGGDGGDGRSGKDGGDSRVPGVRMVEFRYAREGRDADGRQVRRDTRLRIPLLAMISLPRLEIDSLNVKFLVGLQSVSTAKTSPRLGIPRDLQDRYPFLQGHGRLRVAPASRASGKGGTQTTRPYDLEITLAVSSEEPGDGVERITTALAGIITEETK